MKGVGLIIRRLIAELHPFIESSETGQSLTDVLIAMLQVNCIKIKVHRKMSRDSKS